MAQIITVSVKSFLSIRLGRQFRLLFAFIVSWALITVWTFRKEAMAATTHHPSVLTHDHHKFAVAASGKTHRSARKHELLTPRRSIVRARTASDTFKQGEFSPTFVKALQSVEQDMKVDPHLLLSIALTESSFNSKARNHHSSARGLLQFTNVTWLTVIRDFGARHGFAQYAASITTDRDGHLTVKKPRIRRAILALRDDPVLETLMTAERLQQERGSFEARLGRPARAADLYFLHLLGPAGAVHFLSELSENSNASSVETVGSVAVPNAGLFIKNGEPMSVSQAYANIQRTLDDQATRYGHLLHPKLVTVADVR